MVKRKAAVPDRKSISLALQGGGSHGAFQWPCWIDCSRTTGWISVR
jgi:hypothetical protein